MLAVITCSRNSVFALDPFLTQFRIFARGNTNAARPIRTNPNNVALTAIDVPALNQESEAC